MVTDGGGESSTTIDAWDASRIFCIANTFTSARFRDVTLENGDSAGADIPGCNGVAPSGSGSVNAILIDGSGDSSIMNSGVRNSIIWGRGAISHENTSILSIKNTSSMDNESTVSGGAVHYDGCGDITITRSRFGGNIARSPSEAIYSRHWVTKILHL